jgi:hypothetical protein
MKEYVVTLKNKEDLEEFYDQMESKGLTRSLFVPSRQVDCSKKRPISRNTHYILDESEVELLKKDDRILDVQPTPEDLGIEIKPCGYSQTSSDWNKSTSNNADYLNWGLLRCYEGSQRSNWGSNGTASQTGTINITSTGKNVDVVVCDGFVDPNHPEMAVNPDGSGGTRVVQYNWLLHNDPQGTYQYGIYSGDSNNHGMHVAGTIAGITQGWAREANIYNMYIYSGGE